MLQHSRIDSGKKEPTDINVLAEEYLRIAYHSFRGKHESIEIHLEKSIDHSIGLLNLVPQEIGKVLLNLYNNAYYAVTEKAKLNIPGYKPEVMLTTKKENGSVEISVKDNGLGIPQGIIDKIFQPFFTTKPTGQGTGLGLSLSYDIIKAQKGRISVKSMEGEGSDFTISLNGGS